VDASTANDFDFLIGNWRVAHCRLKDRLAGSATWEEFGGTCSAHRILGGFGNVDDNLIELPAGAYRAATLRAFDPATRRWTIWWLDARKPRELDPPMIGGFANGVGTFYGDDAWQGRPLRVRFLWTRLDSGAPRWEQAFSLDAGASWETNWVMDFSPEAAKRIGS
jgi:hypothetical protein